jgi:hypothetical protein
LVSVPGKKQPEPAAPLATVTGREELLTTNVPSHFKQMSSLAKVILSPTPGVSKDWHFAYFRFKKKTL